MKNSVKIYFLAKDLFYKLFFSISSIFLFISCENKYIMELNGLTMGTTYNIKIAKKIKVENIQNFQNKIDSVLIYVNELFSTYIPNSEISKFNTSDSIFYISDDFKQLFLLSKNINENTKGAFDPTVYPLVKIWGFDNNGSINKLPEEKSIHNILSEIGFSKIKIKGNSLYKLNKKIKLDFSAVAKGYGVDAVSKYLLSINIQNFKVEIGGEVYCNGKKFNRQWKIGLQNPFYGSDTNKILKIISLNNMALATSGNYHNYFEIDGIRYSHTIDPSTGFPVTHDIVSVSVVAKNCATADAYATALMVLDIDKGMKLINSFEELEAVIIYGNKTNYKIMKSNGIDKIMTD